MQPRSSPQKLVGEVQMFRLRVAAAESRLKLLHEQVRQAKRRRKEAKRLAQRARVQFKRFRAEVTDLREALAKAETRLFRAGKRALVRKMANAQPVAGRRARSSKKSKTTAGQLSRATL